MISISPAFSASVIDLACVIQQIPGPTFQEEQRAAFIQERFEQEGLKDVQRDSAGNVLARLPASLASPYGRPAVISAHLDTVHPFDSPLDLQRSPDRVTGRAIGDNSLAVAAMTLLPRLLRENNATLAGDLWLAANTCEEGLGNLRGIQAVVNRFEDSPLAYLVLEGMGLGNVLHRGLGVERYRVTIQTPGGHSWVDYGQPSAIHELCSLVTLLVALPLPSKPITTLNVGIIKGGISVNSIADLAWIELDLRSEGSRELSDLVAQVRQKVQTAQKGSIHASIEQIGKRLAGSIPKTHPLVELACEVLAELGLQPKLDIASTDANLPLSRGYPAICIGLTHGSNAHAADEYILAEPVGLGLAQVYKIVTRLWETLS